MKWWNNLCKKCGCCCYKKKVIEGVCFIDINDPCEFLDTETKECMVYQDRFRMCPECRKMTVFHPFFCDYLPDSCGYVEFFRKYGWLKRLKAALGVLKARLRSK